MQPCMLEGLAKSMNPQSKGSVPWQSKSENSHRRLSALSCENSLWGTFFIALLACLAGSAMTQAIGQESAALPTNEQAQLLFRDAGRAFADGQFSRVLEKVKQVVELLPDDARVQQRAGELLYRSGHVLESLKHFDRANELEPARADHNWQRGIALATAGEFEKGAEQFENHHRVNPDDVENSAWHFLCVAKYRGLNAAKASLLPSRGDQRPMMMPILSMYRQEKSADQLLNDLKEFQLDLSRQQLAASQAQDQQLAAFYAALYLGLYHDALEMKQEASKYFKQSIAYQLSGYMADVSRVYFSARFKDSDGNAGNDQP